MHKRRLGHTDLEVPAIMLGGNVFGWTLDEAASFRLLDRAFELGLTFIDTANMYSTWMPGHTGGESETIIGKWFARSGKRDKVVVATKVGLPMGDGKQGLSAQYILQEAEESLRRLQTDRIDLYQSHKDDEKTPIEETLGAYDRLIREGKVRFIGASNYSGARLREAFETSARQGLPRYESLQPLYNLIERKNYESDLAPVVAEYGLGVIPYYALASGFLTGKYRGIADTEGRARGAGIKKFLNDHGFAVLKALDEVAAEHHATPASVALAWLISQPGVTSAIASATSEQQLDDMVMALGLKLDNASIAKLTAASAA